MASLRSTVENCLDAGGTVSVREDVLGVYGDDNPQDRSVLDRLDRIRNDPFVRVALVTVRPRGSTAGQYADLQLDLDSANTVYGGECGAWVYPVGSRVVTTDLLGGDGRIDVNDCLRRGYHTVSREEDALFDLGRDMGADVVCYYVGGDTWAGHACASHPRDRPGFWITRGEANRWTFVHELTHVVGENLHVYSKTNLMYPTKDLENPPPNLTGGQCNRILNDELTERC
jgi:hypothetical protein